MLRQATEDLNDDDSIYIRYRLDGNLFNLRRLQAHTKTQEQLIQDLLFADDTALVAHTERALQRLTSCFAEAAQLFGLEISLKKTEVLHQSAPQEEYHPPHISIDETELNTVHKFAIRGASSHQTPRLTRRSTTDWLKQTVHSVGCTNVCGETSTWKIAPKSVYTGLPYSLLSCTAPSRGLPTAASFGSSSVSISAVSVPSSTFTGVNSSPTSRFSNRRNWPVLKPCCWSHSYAG